MGILPCTEATLAGNKVIFGLNKALVWRNKIVFYLLVEPHLLKNSSKSLQLDQNLPPILGG